MDFTLDPYQQALVVAALHTHIRFLQDFDQTEYRIAEIAAVQEVLDKLHNHKGNTHE